MDCGLPGVKGEVRMETGSADHRNREFARRERADLTGSVRSFAGGRPRSAWERFRRTGPGPEVNAESIRLSA